MVSPAVIEQLDPNSLQLGGKRADITVLFADIRGFTTYSESMEAEKLVSILNLYLAAMAEAVLENEGTIDKFMRDAIMAWFNAPVPQQFDPADRKYTPFYRALAERKLPFLSHVGYEFSLIGKDQSVGEPDRLRLALEEGATVIAAHACSYGLILYEKFLPTLRDLVTRYPHFYADISALTLPNRMRMLLHLRQYPELHERLLFGTDYPLSVFHMAAWGRVALGTLRKMIGTKNRFDRQVEVCNGLQLGFRSLGDLLPHSSGMAGH